jgi:serine/threonine-protein kinase
MPTVAGLSDDVHALTGLRVGSILLGKYRIERLLGVGGMGAVLEATHLQLDDRVAIKILLREALELPEAVSRFEQEARAAARIKHEHVVRVTDVGELPGDVPYMVMEYLEGTDLAALLSERGALSAVEAIEYLTQACEGIAATHAQGVVHRDLKPSNLFLAKRADGSSSLKVVDFGISKVMPTSASGLRNITQISTGMGTPSYMSPEQMASARDVDGRADLWSLGVIAYELLTGRLPFVGEDIAQLCSLALTTPAPPMRSPRGDLPPRLEAVVMRCLEKDRAERYADANALCLALKEALLPAPAVHDRRGWAMGGALVLGLALATTLLLRSGPSAPARPATPASPSYAVAPIQPTLAPAPEEAPLPLEAIRIDRAQARGSLAPHAVPGSALSSLPVVPSPASSGPKRRTPQQLMLDRK